MRRRLPILLLLALAACGGEAREPQPLPSDLPFAVEARLVIEPAGGEAVMLQVAIAETPEERQQGLMGVPEMPEDVGMVFLHDEPTESDFWMKNTLIPLSVAVWDESGTIQEIVDMQPCREDPCEIYEIRPPWIGAVEANLGYFERHGIAVGDTVRLER